MGGVGCALDSLMIRRTLLGVDTAVVEVEAGLDFGAEAGGAPNIRLLLLLLLLLRRTSLDS